MFKGTEKGKHFSFFTKECSRNVCYAAQLKSILIFSSFMHVWSQNISGRVMRKSLLVPWVPWRFQCRAPGCSLLWLCPSTDCSSLMFRVSFIGSRSQSWLPFGWGHLNTASGSLDSGLSKQRSSVLGWP